jgi:hypothetical protein
MAWITLTSAFGTFNLSGTEGDGKITAGIGVCAALFALLGLTKARRGFVINGLGLAVVGAAMAVYEWRNVSAKMDAAAGTAFHASVGIGLWVMLAGFAVAVVCLYASLPAKTAAD